MELVIATLGGLMLGVLGGYVIGRANGRAQLHAYIKGREDEHRQRCEHDHATGGPCWVKGQLPPGAHE